MAYTEKNKSDFGLTGSPPAGGTDNKTLVTTSYGDMEPLTRVEPDNHADVAHDGAGFSSAGREMWSPLDPALAPNKFPRETGHDSLTEEEAQLT